jgi:hypothetical protein
MSPYAVEFCVCVCVCVRARVCVENQQSLLVAVSNSFCVTEAIYTGVLVLHRRVL